VSYRNKPYPVNFSGT
jgi:double-strand break repair protein MRE11